MWVVLILIYFPVSKGTYLIDDIDYIVNDAVLEDPAGIFRIWLSPFENNGVWPYIPVTRTSFWLERQLWGLSPSASLWINVGLHGLTASLLWIACWIIRIKYPWLIAMVFLVHPVHVQSVAWVIERKNTLSGPFFLLCIIGYLMFIRTFEVSNPASAKKHKAPWKGVYFLTLTSAVLAFLSSAKTVMLPLVLVGCHLAMGAPWKRKMVIALIPILLLAVGAGMFRIYAEANLMGDSGLAYTYSFQERVLIATQSLFFYLEKLVFPHPLMFTYPKWNPSEASLSAYLPIFSVFAIAGITLWKFNAWGKNWFLGLGAFLLLLFPMLGFFYTGWFQFSFVTNHWLYLASFPIVGILVGTILWLRRELERYRQFYLKPRVFEISLILAILSCFTYLARQEVLIYQSPERLWTTNLRHNPEAWLAHQELGKSFLEAENFYQAANHLNRAIELNSRALVALNNRGAIHVYREQWDKAIEDYSRAAEINPLYVLPFLNRGNIHLEQHNYSLALEDFSHVIQVSPYEVRAWELRGELFFRTGTPKQACLNWGRACELNSCGKWQQNRCEAVLEELPAD